LIKGYGPWKLMKDFSGRRWKSLACTCCWQ